MSQNRIKIPKILNWKSLSLFVILALIGLGITIMKPDLTAYQQFYLRIFIGLAAAGIAAIIPGFFEINLKWLENTIKAGGAIGVFLLIYWFNPPEFNKFDEFETLNGKWFYDVHPSSNALGFNSKHYGGTVKFKTENDKLGKNLSMNGVIEWKYNENDSLIQIKSSTGFKTVSGGVTADDKLMYEYQTIDNGKQINGFIIFDLLRDSENKIAEMNGTFFRTTEPFVLGVVNARKDKPYYERK